MTRCRKTLKKEFKRHPNTKVWLAFKSADCHFWSVERHFKNPYLFLEDWRRNDAKMEIEICDTECLGQIQLREKWGRQWTVIKIWGKNWKSFKNYLRNAKHMFFVTEMSRQQVVRASYQNIQRQNCEKFSKCFLRLEGLLARESRAKPRKSLCTLRDWTLHSRTSRQN